MRVKTPISILPLVLPSSLGNADKNDELNQGQDSAADETMHVGYEDPGQCVEERLVSLLLDRHEDLQDFDHTFE